MAKKNNKTLYDKIKNTRIFCTYIGIVLSVLFLAIIAVFVFTGQFFSKNNLEIETYEIYSFEDLKDSQSEFLNDVYSLREDIYIKSDFTIGDENNFFNGEFNGNGHTIYVDVATTKSLFYAINKGATITNVNIIYTKQIDVLQEDFGCLATYNYGTIEDCYVETMYSILIGKALNVGGMIAFNYGKIKNSIVNVKFDEITYGDINLLKHKSVGGIVSKSLDNSLIENCLSIVNSKALTENTIYKCGSIMPIKNNDLDNIVNCYGLLDDQSFYDKGNEYTRFMPYITLTTPSFYTDYLKFDSNKWDLNNGIPKVKINILGLGE